MAIRPPLPPSPEIWQGSLLYLFYNSSLLPNIIQEWQAFGPEISGCGSSLHPTHCCPYSIAV
ncbi:hypothetical protein ACP70R_043252 [Stipagrostis hirtigluma subsp. patula]